MRSSIFTYSLLFAWGPLGCASDPGPGDGNLAAGGSATGGFPSEGTGSANPGSGGLGVGGSGGLSGTTSGAGGSGEAGGSGGSADAGGSSNTGGATATGGGYNCGAPTTLPRTYDAVLTCVLKPGCQSSICHGGEVPLLLIDAWEDFPRREDHSPYDLLTETLLKYTVDHCANSPLVDPGHPENSAIIKALSRSCDDPSWGMPDGCFETPCVPQEYIDFIAEWIAAGAEM